MHIKDVVVVRSRAGDTRPVSHHSWIPALAVALLVHCLLFLAWSSSAGRIEEVTSEEHLHLDRNGQGSQPSRMGLARVQLLDLEDFSIQEAAVLQERERSRNENPSSGGQALPVAGRSAGQRASGLAGRASASPRDDSSLRSAAVWNHRAITQEGRASALRRGKSFTESLARSPNVEYSSRKIVRRRGLRGQIRELIEARRGHGPGGVPGQLGHEAPSSKSRYDVARASAKKNSRGVPDPNRVAPRQNRGPAAEVNKERGRATSWASAAALSARRRVSPFEMGVVSTGGRVGLGAGGAVGHSSANQGARGRLANRGAGAAALSSVSRAERSNPYFSEMYRRIDRELVFPHKLALALEQGEVVLRFRLDRGGRVLDLRVDKPSEFAEFDREALRAFRAVAPLGAVPKALLAGRSSLPVIAPYTFRNPLIR